jgi:hypothetical protein
VAVIGEWLATNAIATDGEPIPRNPVLHQMSIGNSDDLFAELSEGSVLGRVECRIVQAAPIAAVRRVVTFHGIRFEAGGPCAL